MAAPRLPFLWPVLFNIPKTPSSARRITGRSSGVTRFFTATACRAQGPAIQRYGTAQEPAEHLREQNEQKDKVDQAKPSTEVKPQNAEQDKEDQASPDSTPSSAQTEAPNTTDPVPSAPPEPPRVPESKPLDTVLHMPSPAEDEKRKPPHLRTPPYVHHFDTYGSVKDLSKSGFNSDQAVTVMKGVRSILTSNMELAREGLVSKSNVENETYLFRAACSELRTEIGNKRKSEVEKMRSERNQLQHEVDILNQRLGQETSHLKDELKGLFDDRKMAVRQEQRTAEAKIQELNYKITIALNSEARSEVEGLRWVLTRRAAMTLGVSAFMLFVALRYMSYVNHNQSEERKKSKERSSTPDQGQGDASPRNNGSTGNEQGPIGAELLSTEGGVSLA